MKLFLYSFAFNLSDEQFLAFENLIGKKPHEISIVVIDNAADYIPNSKEWVHQTHKLFTDRGYTLHFVDLTTPIEEKNLLESFADTDVIWINAGNTFYLRYLLQKAGADKIIQKMVAQGVVYAGWSAGAIIAGTTLKHIDLMEETPKDVPVILEGLGMTETTVIPHMDNPEFSEHAKKVKDALTADGIKIQPLQDNQVLIINGNSQVVL